MTFAASLGTPLPRRPRRHGDRRTIAAEAERCRHCGQAIRRNPVNAWSKVRDVLARVGAPVSAADLRKATGLKSPNVTMALAHHAHEITRTGKRGSYRYSLKASA